MNGWLNICGAPGWGRDQSCVASSIGPRIFCCVGGQRRGADNHVGRDDTADEEPGADVPSEGVAMGTISKIARVYPNKQDQSIKWSG
jgi:hypothetical protein